MTAATTKGVQLTAQLITDPRTLQKSTSSGAPLRIYAVNEALATTRLDDIGDITLMLALPSSSVVHQLFISATDMDSATSLAYDVGLYNGPDKIVVPVSGTSTKYAPFAVLDADAFASAITVGQAAVNAASSANNYRFEAIAAANDITTVGSKLWELVGMDVDPNKMFVIGITITTAAGTPVAGSMSIQAMVSH
jgi:hypothetical protein